MRKWLTKPYVFFTIDAYARSITATLVLLLVYSSAMSQAEPYNYNPVPNIMSAEAASLGKYGSYNVNYYTGVPDISIPLHSISENGIDVNISLSYDASGLIPNKNASIVGLNWNLIVGGAITRTVNGKPDDRYNPNVELGNTNVGYIYGQLNGYGTYTPEHIRTIQFISDINHPVYNLAYEYIPDVFSFNFLGHSGKFFMDNAGQIRVTGDRNYKVDLVNMKPQYDFLTTIGAVTGSVNSLNNTLYSQIKMTSDDGYTFYFGGSLKTLEIGFNCEQYVSVPESKGGQINAWYLTRVVSPDGNEILFNYKNYSENDFNYFKNLFNAANGSHMDIAAGFMELKLFRNHSIVVHKMADNPMYMQNTREQIFSSLVKHAYLEEIKTRTQTITFEYSPKDLDKKFYGDPDAIITNIWTLGSIIRKLHTQRLHSIIVSDNFNPNTGKSIELMYTYYGNSYSNRMFLTNLLITGNGGSMPYSFTYNNTGDLPNPLTRGIDLWGNYNGRNGNTDLVVEPVMNAEYESNPANSSAYRLPDATYAKYGLLNTITYPTGGITQFTFEGNTYSKVLKRKVSSGITPVWETVSGNAGGLRIAEIKNTPGITTTYKYVTDYNLNENNPSSGLLTDYPVNFLYFKIPHANGDEVMARISDNNIAAASSYGESHIAYKEVVEINSEGFTKYKFTNPETNPDQYYLGEDSYKYTAEVSSTDFLQQLKRLYRYSSREDERGKLLATEYYNPAKQVKKGIYNEYNNDPLRGDARSIAHYCSFNFVRWGGDPVSLVQSYALFHYHNLLSKVTEKTYSSNSNDYIEQVTRYKYKSNTNRLLVEKSVTQSDGSELVHKYKYPADMAPTAPYNQMLTKNMLRHVIESGEYRDGTQFIQSSKTNYGSWHSGNILKPSSVEHTVNAGQPEVLTLFTNYDNRGNLLTASKTGSSNPHFTSYIWDYNQRFPVAEITNNGSGEYAYTSFEADGMGGWVYSGTVTYNYPDVITGLRKYTLTPTNAITRSDLQTGMVYIVTYWTKNSTAFNIPGTTLSTEILTSNGWHCFEHKVTAQTTITISGSGDIDELRLYPAGTVMTTYTWSGAGSMTSQNDAGNRITYFEYDGLNRLVLVRDQDKNIVKRICYNFAGQPVDNCSVDMTPNWQLSGNLRCAKDAQNNNTGYQEKEEVDTNPYSSTYNDSRWILGTQNCTACPMPPTWVNTARTECEQADAPHGVSTGRLFQEQKDTNPCSQSYNSFRWIYVGCSASCPDHLADYWVTGNRRCVKDASNNNTGEVELEMKDMNECSATFGNLKWISGGSSCTECSTNTISPIWTPTGATRCLADATWEREEKNTNWCSANYGEIRWFSMGKNCTACPITNCTGINRKLINCNCEYGARGCISSVYNKETGVYKWKCTYVYCFSDGTWSARMVEYHDTACPIDTYCLP